MPTSCFNRILKGRKWGFQWWHDHHTRFWMFYRSNRSESLINIHWRTPKEVISKSFKKKPTKVQNEGSEAHESVWSRCQSLFKSTSIRHPERAVWGFCLGKRGAHSTKLAGWGTWPLHMHTHSNESFDLSHLQIKYEEPTVRQGQRSSVNPNCFKRKGASGPLKST